MWRLTPCLAIPATITPSSVLDEIGYHPANKNELTTTISTRFHGVPPTSCRSLDLAIVFRVLIPFALGYFLSYVFRVVNAVIQQDLVAELGLDASDLGLLTSTYFLTFAAFQIPLGMLLDRFGPRKTESFLMLIAAAGAVVFALAPNREVLILGRGLIGFGVSACLMAAFKAFILWFPKGRLPLINGIQMAVGGVGAMAASVPVERALQFTDWRGIFLGLGALTVLGAALIFFVVPRRREVPEARSTLRELFGGVAAVMTSPVFWRLAPLTFASQASFLSVQSLWIGPWLRDIGGLDQADVAQAILVVSAAMTVGFILAGGLAERLGRIGIAPVPVALVVMTVSMAVQLVLVLQLAVPPVLIWSLFALFGTSGILVYAGLSQAFPLHLAGRVNTGLNLLVFVGSFAFQWGIGGIIDLWPMAENGGYRPEAYQAGFAMILGVQVLAALWCVVFRKGKLPLRV